MPDTGEAVVEGLCVSVRQLVLQFHLRDGFARFAGHLQHFAGVVEGIRHTDLFFGGPILRVHFLGRQDEPTANGKVCFAQVKVSCCVVRRKDHAVRVAVQWQAKVEMDVFIRIEI